MNPFHALIDRWRNAPLSVKLIGAITLFLALVMLGNGLYITLSEQRILSEQLDDQGESLAKATSIFAIEPLLIRDYPVLETFTDNMVKEKHNVDKVTVFRADGKAVATSRLPGQDNTPQYRHRSYVAQIKSDHADERSIGWVEITLSTYRSERLVVERLWTIGGISIFTFLLLGFLIAWLIRNSVARPLRSLEEKALALGQGDLDTTITLPSRDELGTLANTLEAMRHNLKISYGAIEKQNRELKELDRMKDEFLAKISHELNTPLNAILGLSSALSEGAYGELDATLREPVNTINSSGRRLQSLAEQLLTFNQQAQQPLRYESVEIESLLRELLEAYAVQLSGKKLSSDCRVEAGLSLRADPQLMKQIFGQLLDNAVKFTDAGRVELSAESIGEEGIAVCVIDTGAGIPQEVQPRIYERFEQGFGYETRSHEGAGMGLALVKQGVERLRGLILLDSAPGTGSRFTVILPRSDAASADEIAAEWEARRPVAMLAKPSNAETVPISPDASDAEWALVAEPARPVEDTPGANAERAVILVVDDDRANRMVARRYLRGDYSILEVNSGNKCLDVLDAQSVSLVLLDLMMPGMSGFDVLEHIKTHPEKQYPPVIVVSALIENKTISRVFNSGAVDYLTKPFNHAELRARVNTHIELAERELHLEQKVRERTSQLRETNERLEETFQQLLQSEKMASIGQLAAGVAHEINNPIGFVSSNLSTLNEYVDNIFGLLEIYNDLEGAIQEGNADRQRLHLDRIAALRGQLGLEFILEDIPGLLADTREGTKRVRSIVQGMKAFAHADDGEMAEHDINDAIETTLKMVWNELKYKCEVRKSLGELPKTCCNINQLNQVFTNLLVNAAHAIDDHGEIDIRTQHAGNEIVVEIADTGRGIDPEHLPHLFEPFFTTKPVGQGTGLGLYLSYEIIQKHKGSIDVQSEPGQGTRFIIHLPVACIPNSDGEVEGQRISA